MTSWNGYGFCITGPLNGNPPVTSALVLQSACNITIALLWRHNGPDGSSNHQPRDCLFNRLFGHRSKKISKLRVTDLCPGNSPVTSQIPRTKGK